MSELWVRSGLCRWRDPRGAVGHGACGGSDSGSAEGVDSDQGGFEVVVRGRVDRSLCQRGGLIWMEL